MNKIVPTNKGKLLEQADQFLNSALEESQRSESDSVTHTICMKSRKSSANYMMCFLFEHNKNPEQPITLERLLEQCIELNPNFKQVDLSVMGCRHKPGEEAYCLGVDDVGKCLNVAKELKSIVNSTG